MKPPWKTMETNQKPWNHLEKHGNQPKTMENHETTLRHFHGWQTGLLRKWSFFVTDRQTLHHNIYIIIIIGSSSWDIDVSSWVEFVPTATRTTLWVYEGTGNVTSVWTLAVCGRFLYWKDLRVSNKVTTRWEGPQSLSYHKYSLSKDGLLYTDSCVNKFV